MDLLGRFDWSWDGVSPPKLMEFNSDTPSLLLESSIISEDFWKDTQINTQNYQSNYIEEAIKQAIKQILDECNNKIGIVKQDYDDESSANMGYLNTLFKAQGAVTLENMSELKVIYDQNVKKSGDKVFIDPTSENQCKPTWKLLNTNVNCLVNQYPKEWLVNEFERDELLKYDLADLRTFEPWWKLILSNKAILPLLWSMYPDHPNLLPAFFDDPIKNSVAKKEDIEKSIWVSKPIYGREGLGVLLSDNYTSFEEFQKATTSNFGKDNSSGITLGHSIYQLYKQLPESQGRVIQTSSWIVNSKAAGLNFRETKAGTHFSDNSPFLPHIVKKGTDAKYTFTYNKN